VNVLIVSRWFVQKRGTALGMTLVGTSLGGIIFPRLGASLLRTHTWREAMLIEAGIPLVVMVILGLVTRDSPSELGLRPLGSSGAPGSHQAATGMEYREAIRTRTFWILTFCAMTTFYCILAAQAHMVLHLKGMGWPLEKAAGGVGILFTMGLIGKFVIGYLADKLERRIVFLSNLSIMLVGALCLASMNESLLWPFILIFGLGWGGLYTMLQLTCMDSFGTRAGGKILGTITVLDAIGGGLGIWITGVLFDRTRSYESAFMLIAFLVFLALLAALALQNPAAGAKGASAKSA
jgi:sugar phosphate permease